MASTYGEEGETGNVKESGPASSYRLSLPSVLSYVGHSDYRSAMSELLSFYGLATNRLPKRKVSR